MQQDTKRRLAATALALGVLVAALLVTCVAEFVVLSYVVDSQVKAAEASGVSAPNEGFTGSHMDLLIWFYGVFVVAFLLAITVLGIFAVWMWQKWLPPRDEL